MKFFDATRLQIVLSFILVNLIWAPTANAQNYEEIGTDPFTNTSYECVRYAESSLNTILVNNGKTGKEKNLNIKKAKNKIKQILKKSRERNKTLNSRIKELKKKRERLQSKIPLKIEEIELLDETIAKLDLKVAENSGRKEVLKFILDSVKDCKKDVPVVGRLRIFTHFFELNGQTRFAASLLYVVDNTPPPSSIRALVSGHLAPLPGAGGVYYQEPPNVVSLSVQQNLCLHFVNNDCIKRLQGAYVKFASYSGPQNPGTCGEAAPYNCSLSEAMNRLSSRAGAIDIVIKDAIYHGHGHGHGR